MDHGLDPQLFTFLCAPKSYGPEIEAVEIIETHASVVFLAGDYAYKIYKNINLGYLDYGSQKKRRHAAQREFELNHPFAPGLYLGLCDITKDETGFHLGGAAAAIETAVRMRRFPQSALLSAMADQDLLAPPLAVELAMLVRSMHKQAPQRRNVDQVARLGDVLALSCHALSRHAALFPADMLRSWSNACKAMLDNAAPILREREKAGFVRRCHGDLHLGNLVMIDNAPTPFDALEFNEDLATTDILYDLAFLLMDLMHRGFSSFANSLLCAYCARCEPSALAGLTAMPFWLSMRAGIRAYVAADRAEELDAGPERNSATAQATDYFATAQRLIRTGRPRVIAIGGLSGSGKTTVARVFAPSLGRPIGALLIRSDVERKALFGVNEFERLPEDAYRPDVSEKLYARMREKARTAIRAGFSVIIDAVHAAPRERDAIERIAVDAEAPFLGLWLDAPEDVLKKRINKRRSDASDADASVVDQQLSYNLGDINWLRADSDALRNAKWPAKLARFLEATS